MTISKQKLDYLGFRLYGDFPNEPTGTPLDLERVLFDLLVYLERNKDEGRLLGALKSWFRLHGDKVIVHKLKKLRDDYFNETDEDLNWLRYFAYYNKSLGRHYWEKLTPSLKKKKTAFYSVSNEKMAKLSLERWGLETFLPKNSNLKIHKNALRDRDEDVLSEIEFLKKNLQYQNRFKIGLSIKSDISTFWDIFSSRSIREFSEFLTYDYETVRKNTADYKKLAEVGVV